MDRDEMMNLAVQAVKAGADACEVVFARRAALSIGVRLGALEEVEREESRDLGLRAIVGKRQASVSGSDISTEGKAKLVERVVAMAQLAPEDPYAGLPAQDRLANGVRADLDLYDPTEMAPEALEAEALEAEDALRAVPKVTNSNGASASWSFGEWRLASSDGFFGARKGSVFSLSAQAIAGEGAGMEQGYEGRATRWRGDLPDPKTIGAEAARRAVESLNARKIDSTTAPVIFESRVATALIRPFIGAISGPAVARGVSFLKDKLGEQIFAEGVTISDDPHRLRGLGSSPFDDEGVANTPMKLIDKGMLTTWLLNSSAGRQLGMPSTGHASRGLAEPPGVGPGNLVLEPGEMDLAALMKAAGTGLLVTSTFGPSLNSNTGDWSVGCSGQWFENGEIAYPVTEITVAGNLLDLFKRLVPGADLVIRSSSDSPSILIDALAIAGK